MKELFSSLLKFKLFLWTIEYNDCIDMSYRDSSRISLSQLSRNWCNYLFLHFYKPYNCINFCIHVTVFYCLNICLFDNPLLCRVESLPFVHEFVSLWRKYRKKTVVMYPSSTNITL